MAIDISSPSAYEREATGVGSVSQLMGDVGKIEGMRRDRLILNKYVTAMAADPTADPASIIAGLEQPQYDSGLLGTFQKIASGMPGGQGSVLGQLQASLVTTPLQRQQIATSKAREEAYGQPAAAKPLTRSNISTAKSKALKILKDAPKVWAHQFGRKNYSQATLTEAYKEYRIDQSYDMLLDADKQKLDKVWDNLIAVRNKTIEGGNEYDWDPESAEIKDLRGPDQSNAGPQSQEEFTKAVQGIEDDTEAKAYYDKWAGKWR